MLNLLHILRLSFHYFLHSYRQQQKCYKNPFFRHFEPSKGYGRVCHRYIGIVTKFGLFRIIIFWSNCHFSAGGGGKRPPYRSRVNNVPLILSSTSFSDSIIVMLYKQMRQIGEIKNSIHISHNLCCTFSKKSLNLSCKWKNNWPFSFSI